MPQRTQTTDVIEAIRQTTRQLYAVRMPARVLATLIPFLKRRNAEWVAIIYDVSQRDPEPQRAVCVCTDADGWGNEQRISRETAVHIAETYLHLRREDEFIVSRGWGRAHVRAGA